jgi:hypothetical protein
MPDVPLEQCVVAELSLTTGVSPQEVQRILDQLGFDTELRLKGEQAQFTETRMVTVEAVQLRIDQTEAS